MSRRGKNSFVVEWERDGLKIKIPVKIHVPCGEFMEDGKIYFTAKHEDSSLDITNSSAEEIKNKIIEHLNNWYTITWELYILIEISGGRGPGGQRETKFDIDVEYTYIAVGKHHDDRIVHMEVPTPTIDDIPDKPHEIWNLKTRWGGREPRAGMPEVGDGHSPRFHYERRKDRTSALVPATKRVASTLELFLTKLDELLANMRERFNPGEIVKTLKAIDSLKQLLLPPGKEE